MHAGEARYRLARRCVELGARSNRGTRLDAERPARFEVDIRVGLPRDDARVRIERNVAHCDDPHIAAGLNARNVQTAVALDRDVVARSCKQAGRSDVHVVPDLHRQTLDDEAVRHQLAVRQTDRPARRGVIRNDLLPGVRREIFSREIQRDGRS